MTDKQLAEIKAREARLVSEKWYYDGETVCEAKHGNPVITANNWGDIMMAPVVGEFIAHARQDIPELVAEVERLREALENIAEGWRYMDEHAFYNNATKYAREALGIDD